MSYGPHPNDFLLVECEIIVSLHRVHVTSDLDQMGSTSTRMVLKRYTSMILFSETSARPFRKSCICSNITGTLNPSDLFYFILGTVFCGYQMLMIVNFQQL